jgi:hypothetical protein
MNVDMGRMSALGANRKRRDGGYDVNEPKRKSGSRNRLTGCNCLTCPLTVLSSCVLS